MKKCTLSCLTFLFLVFTAFNLSAQQAGVTRCATMEEDAARRANNPKLGTLDDFENFLQAEIRKKQIAAQTSFVVGDVYIIPVVVHVIHDNEAVGTGLNINYDRINDQIVTLQNDFRKIAGSPGDNNHPDGADTKIEFRLAKQMPDGTAFPNGEDGVNRIYWDDIPGLTSGNGLSRNNVDGSVKPYTNGQGWDPARYMNFWVADLGGGILGYAQFPSGGLPGMGCSNPDLVTDGVVMTTSSVGGSNFPSGAPPYNLGRTATHEIGHWLGLRHIWGDGGCGVDDFCADTPEASGSNFGCATGNVSCGSTDMVENYMDYSDDLCMNIFTNDQSIRMRTVLETTEVRSKLIQSTTWQDPIANSAMVTHINSPFYELCTGDVEPKVLVSNVGTNVLDDVTIEYTIDGTNTITTSFTGLGVAQGATTVLTLGTSTVTLGDHDISVKVTSPVVQATPETRNFTYTLGFGLPFEENFDNSASFPPASWQLGSSNNCYIWGPGSGTGQGGNQTQAASTDNFESNVAGAKAFLYTPILTMPCGATNVTLDFDVAYKQYDGSSNEGLEVEVSTDCGNTWQATTYSEFGSTLSNSTTTTSAYFPTDAAEWRHKTVNLDAFVASGTDNQMLLRFVSTNDYGNNLYVDNVKVDATYNEVEVTQAGTQVYDGTTVSDFGNSTLNTPIVKTYTVKNTGTATLNLTNNLAVTGTEFTVGTLGSLTLAPGASTTFDVTYTAATGGTSTATVSFGTDDCDEAVFNFDVKGNIPLTCGITNMTVGTQTACDVATNTYTQEVIVTYNDAPASGNLVVAGQSFAIGTSPQTVILTNLTSDGNAVNVTANFSADTNCTLTTNSLFTAPASCVSCGITNLAAGTQTTCNPATNTYTQEVVVTYSNLGAPATGNLVVAGQNFAIATSPQTVTLTNLTSDGNAVDVTAHFSTIPMCSASLAVGLFTAPADCSAPEITVSGLNGGGTLSLGTTRRGTDITKTITIANNGSANLDITSVSISASASITISNALATPAVILPSQTATFDVLMDASTTGTKTATIVIVNNDADEANFVLGVVGRVRNPGPPPPPPIDYTIAPPTNLTGVSVSTTQIDLTWEDNSDNEDGFKVYKNGILIATLPPGTTTFEVLDLEADTFYNFKVKAYNSQKSASTNTLNIATLPVAPTAGQNIGVCGTSGVAYLELGNAPARGSFRWYAEATGGTPLAEVTTGFFTTPTITQTTTFYATAVSSYGLESSPRIAVQAYVYEDVEAQIVEANTILSCDNQATIHAVEQVGATYQWRVNGALTNQTGQELNATISGNYQLIVTRNSCSDTHNFSLTLNYQPDATIANGATAEFCQSGSLSASNVNANATYEWLQNGNVIASGANTTVSQSGVYTLRVTENTCMNEDQISVNVFDLPQNQAITASATEFCVDDVVNLEVPLMANVNYQWFRNGSLLSGAKANTYKAYQGGEYSVKMSVNGLDCEATSATRTISWFVSPEVELTRDDETLSLDISIPHQSVEWFTTGAVEATSFANQTSLSAPPYETYWAVITYPTGCKVTSNSVRFFEAGTTTGGGVPPVGLDDDEEEGKTFEVFPNPSQDGIFQVRLNTTLDADAQLKVSDALGRDLDINISVKQGSETVEVNLSNFASGIYHLQFISSEGTLTKKIIKK